MPVIRAIGIPVDADDFTPPTRESMSDEELANLVKGSQSDEAGILYAMEVLSQQSKVRQRDDANFDAWVAKLEAIGSAEALEAIAAARAERGIVVVEPTKLPDFEPAVEPEVFEAEVQEVAEVENEAATEPQPQIEPELEREPEELEHDLAPLPTNHEWEEVVEVDLDLHTGVAVSDFDAILSTETAEESFEPEDFDVDEDVSRVIASRKNTGNHPMTQFWSWLGLTSGVLPIGLGFVLHSLGLTGLQAFVALVAGVAASTIVIAVGAVAGKRAGLPTLILSRATFGVFGNLVPGILNVVIRFAFTAVIAVAGLQLLDGHLGTISLAKPLFTDVSSEYLSASLIALVVLVGLAALIAGLGDRVTYRVQQVAGILGLAAPILLLVQSPLKWQELFTVSGTSWWVTFAAALVIFAGFGGIWSSSSADFARGIAPSSSGFLVFIFAKLGLVLLPIISGSIGILLASSASSFSGDLVAAIATANWQQLTFVSLLTVALITWLAMSLTSAGFGFRGLGLNLSSAIVQPILGLLVIASALAIFVSHTSAWAILDQYLAFAGVPLLAWTGFFTAETLIRRIAYHEVSLQRSYGIYRGINWINVAGFALATGLGWGYISSHATALSWVGYLIQYSGNFSFWHEAQLGLAMAFLVGLLFPVAFGIPRIKRQEEEVLAIEKRRHELNDVTI